MTDKTEVLQQDDGQIPRSLCHVHLEESALGAAMLSQDQGAQLLRELSIEDFTVNFTRDIFMAMQTLGPQGLGDYALLACELERAGKHYNVADLTYLDFGVVATTTEMAIRIARLRELRRLRQLARLGERITAWAFEVGAKSSVLIPDIEAALEAIRQ